MKDGRLWMAGKKLYGWFSLLAGINFLLMDLAMVVSRPSHLAVPFSLALVVLYAVAGAGLAFLGYRTLRR